MREEKSKTTFGLVLLEGLGPSGVGIRQMRFALEVTFAKSQSRAIHDYCSRIFTSCQTLSNSKETVGHGRKDTVAHSVLMFREELKLD